MEVILIVFVVAVLVAGIVYGHLRERKRTESLRSIADRLGLDFDHAADRTADDRLRHFAMFRKGHSRQAWNIMRGRITLGSHEISIELGDFLYKVTTGTGKNRSTRTYRFSYLAAVNPIGSCPETIIRREGFFDRVKGVLGFDDIDFESVEFSRTFHVSSDDKRFAYDLVDQGMMEFLLEDPPPAVEVDGDDICVSDGKRRWDPEEFEAMVRWVGRMLDRWPAHLKASLRRTEDAE